MTRSDIAAHLSGGAVYSHSLEEAMFDIIINLGIDTDITTAHMD